MKLILILFLSISLYANLILGRIDKFDLPELSLNNIKAKIDTGAKTSSLHCSSIISKKEGYVTFTVLDKENEKFTGETITKKIHRFSNVKSSNGVEEKRYFIKTPIIIFDKEYIMELSLTSRGSMKYPLLIGRELIRQNFIVDVKKSNLSSSNKK